MTLSGLSVSTSLAVAELSAGLRVQLDVNSTSYRAEFFFQIIDKLRNRGRHFSGFFCCSFLGINASTSSQGMTKKPRLTMTDLHTFLSKNCDKAQVAAAVTALTAALKPTSADECIFDWGN